MTKFVFYKRGGVYYGFEEHGHTGYGESGNDVVCAALSAMTMLVINTIESSFGGRVDYEISKDDADIKVTSRSALAEYESDAGLRYAVSGIFKGYFLQLTDMLEDYYGYIDLDEIEK